MSEYNVFRDYAISATKNFGNYAVLLHPINSDDISRIVGTHYVPAVGPDGSCLHRIKELPAGSTITSQVKLLSIFQRSMHCYSHWTLAQSS